jgi:hypothetical protein
MPDSPRVLPKHTISVWPRTEAVQSYRAFGPSLYVHGLGFAQDISSVRPSLMEQVSEWLAHPDGLPSSYQSSYIRNTLPQSDDTSTGPVGDSGRFQRPHHICRRQLPHELQAGKMTIGDCRHGKAMLDTLADWERYAENDPLLGHKSRRKIDSSLPSPLGDPPPQATAAGRNIRSPAPPLAGPLQRR